MSFWPRRRWAASRANSEALADFMYDNMILEMNVIHAAWQNGCRKLEFLGSSCIYPRMPPSR